MAKSLKVIPRRKAASTKKATSKNAFVKKATPKKKVAVHTVDNQYGKGGKTGIIRKMASAGRSRKQILDKLESLNPDIPRKTNAGLVSVELGKMDMRDIPSGVTNGTRKKTITVTAKKKTEKKKISLVK